MIKEKKRKNYQVQILTKISMYLRVEIKRQQRLGVEGLNKQSSRNQKVWMECSQVSQRKDKYPSEFQIVGMLVLVYQR